jgi:hypothetical protein
VNGRSWAEGATLSRRRGQPHLGGQALQGRLARSGGQALLGGQACEFMGYASTLLNACHAKLAVDFEESHRHLRADYSLETGRAIAQTIV